MAHRITIEDVDLTFGADDGEVLLFALLAQGVRFAYSCQAGNCGACKCQVISGEVDCLVSSDGLISDEEQMHGVVLACRARVRSDLVLRRELELTRR